MFTAALFTIATIWKKPECPKTDDWLKTLWYSYTIEYYAAVRKDEIMKFTYKCRCHSDYTFLFLRDIFPEVVLLGQMGAQFLIF